MNIWNEICHKLNNCKSRDVLENVYEDKIVDCLALLNWSEADGEIRRQYPIQVGHEPKRADIVISSNGMWQFVIEVKRPNHTIQGEDKKQLQSYMRQLKVRFGLYIGENIQLFYDDDSPIDIIKVLDIEIKESDSNGIKFIELFHKDNYTPQAVLDFYEDIKRKQAEERRRKEEIAMILADTDGSIFKELLRKEYHERGESSEWIESILSQFRISVAPIQNTTQSITISPTPFIEKKEYDDKGKGKDHTQYRVDGSEWMGKGKLAWYVIKRYGEENLLNFSEYELIFNQLKGGKKHPCIQRYENATPDRYRIVANNIDYSLSSADNVKFVVNRDWQKENIQAILAFAKKQGYQVEECNPNKKE